MQTNLQWQRTSVCLGIRGGGKGKGEDTKKNNAMYRGDRYVHYLDCVDGFMGICKRQNLSNCILYRYAVYFMSISP